MKLRIVKRNATTYKDSEHSDEPNIIYKCDTFEVDLDEFNEWVRESYKMDSRATIYALKIYIDNKMEGK